MNKRTAIVGLGLMGGSLALALRPHLPYLSIVDTNSATLTAAANLADLVTADLEEGIHLAELVILATPVRSILQMLTDLPRLRPDGCLLMDLGSTKVEVDQAMVQLPTQFEAIGGHPMCGKEVAGFTAATANLYQDQTFVLCRNARSSSNVEAVARKIVSHIGARPLFLPATLHDQLVAATSHLPYLLAATLIRVVASKGDTRSWGVSATGFRDTTRLAGSDAEMMSDILMTNRQPILEALRHYQAELATVTRLLEAADETELTCWINEMLEDYRSYRHASQREGNH